MTTTQIPASIPVNDEDADFQDFVSDVIAHATARRYREPFILDGQGRLYCGSSYMGRVLGRRLILDRRASAYGTGTTKAVAHRR